MPSNEQTHGGDKADSKKQPAKPAPENPDLLAQKRIHPAAIVQRTKFAPHTVALGDVLQLQQTLGNQAVQRLLASHNIQAKLIVGAAGDAYEQQADQVADQIIQPTHTSQLAAQNSEHASLPEITRKSAPSSSTPNQGFAVGEKLEQVIQNQRGNGRPLPGELRQEMEIKMGADFSDVRLHTNNAAAQLNRRLAARAFTQGKDIFLDSGGHDPSSQEGKRLLAHELTHVIQQTGKQPPVNGAGNVASRPSSLASTGVVQRDPDDDKLKAAAQKSDAPAPSPVPAPAASASSSGYGVSQAKESAVSAAAASKASHYGNYIPPDEIAGAAKPAAPVAPAPNSHYGEFIPTGAAPVAGTMPAESASKKASDVFRDPKRARESMAVKLVEAAKKPHPDPIKLPEKFKDEDKKIGWRAFQGVPEAEKAARIPLSERKDIVTRYYSDADRERNKLTPATSTPPVLRRAGRPEPGLPPGSERKKLYAMSPAGQAVLGSGPDSSVGEDRVKRNLHHSSIFAGGDVTHAGHIAVEKGKVNYMDDDSGHYRPDAAHTWDAFNRFKEQGQLSEKGTVSMMDKNQEKGRPGYGSGRLNLPFSAYEQTYGNEDQARNKNAMLQQLLARTSKKRAELDAQSITSKEPPPLFREGGVDKGYDYD